MRKTQKQQRKEDILIIGLIVGVPLLILILYGLLSGPQENPEERNYLYFKNDKIENIIDSMYSFKSMMLEYSFPKEENFDLTHFSYYDEILKINGKLVTKNLTFENLRTNEMFIEFTDEQIIKFINIYLYFYKNNISPFRFNYSSGNLYFDYKPYYNMYKTWTYDGHLDRFIILAESKYALDLGFYKILDSIPNIYLYIYKRAIIWGDSTIEYKKK